VIDGINHPAEHEIVAHLRFIRTERR